MPTPVRTFRVDDALWYEALKIAKARGDNLTAVIVVALERYVKRHS